MRVVASLKWCPISENGVQFIYQGGKCNTFGVVIEEFSESGDNIIDGVKWTQSPKNGVLGVEYDKEEVLLS